MRLLLILFIFLFVNCDLKAQDINNNIIKYWNYRDRLQKNFIAIGDKPGQSLPFSVRNEKGYPAIDHGQGPMVLGQYLGVLATEYKLLSENNQDTEQTLKELFYALYAFNRLDLVAETVNGYNKLPKLDGFFVREDFPNDFILQNPSLNKNNNGIADFILGSGKSFAVKCTTFKGTYRCGTYVDKDCNVISNPVGFSSKYNHKPPSLDQYLGVLLGLTLVNKYINEEVKYSNKIFQDNETFIKKEAQNIAKRIVTYVKQNGWTPKEPDGDYMGDCDFVTKAKPNYLKNNATMLYFARFISNAGKNIYGKKYGYPILVDSFTGIATNISNSINGDFYNLRMYLEAITLSNKNNALFTSTSKRVKEISKTYEWEAFFYTLGTALHNWKKEDEIKLKSQIMLNNAPFNGPFYHTTTDYAKGGWASENRFSASSGEQLFGSRFPEISGNYSGLDYMLQHNLHLLTYTTANQKKQFGLLNRSIEKYKKQKVVVDPKIMLKAKLKSCKERYDYYKFLYKFSLKRCDDKQKCKPNIIKYLNKKFDIDFNPKKRKCN